MNTEEALREQIAVVLYERDLARSSMDFWRRDVAAVWPLIREYAERESDARAEAAHAKGYEQGQRDARAPHRICYVDPGSSAVVYAVCVCGEQLIGSYGASLSDLLSIHIRKVAAPDPHPGGTNPVAARVGTDGPA